MCQTDDLMIIIHCSIQCAKFKLIYSQKHPVKAAQLNRQPNWLNTFSTAKSKNVRGGKPNNNVLQNSLHGQQSQPPHHPNLQQSVGFPGSNHSNSADEIMSNDTDLLNWEQHNSMDPLANGSTNSSSGIATSCGTPTSSVLTTTPALASGGPVSGGLLPDASGLDVDSLVPGSPLGGRIGSNNIPLNPKGVTPNLQSPTSMGSMSMGAMSPNMAGSLKPSLQGVKVPDENLTPQQLQHREEQLAKIKQMNQIFFPEHGAPPGSMAGGIGVPGGPNAVPGTAPNDCGMGSNDPNVGMPTGAGPSPGATGPPCKMPMMGNSGAGNPMTGPLGNMGPGGAMGMANPNVGGGPGMMNPMHQMQGPNGPMRGMMGGMRGGNMCRTMSMPMGASPMSEGMMSPGLNEMGGMNCGPGGMPMNHPGAMMGQQPGNPSQMMGMHMPPHQYNHPMQGGPPNQNQPQMMGMAGSPMMSGPGGMNQPKMPGQHMMGGSGNAGSPSMEWNKMQNPYFEEGRIKTEDGSFRFGPGDCNMPFNMGSGMGSPGQMSAQRQMNQSQMRQNAGNAMAVGNARSQGPPPPYHQTQRSASVPIATQSPNPNSPNNPTSNLSLPSPRGGSALNSPAESHARQQQLPQQQHQSQFKHLAPGQSPTSIDSPAGMGNSLQRSINHSNPTTPLSSHLSPNASLKELELGNPNNSGKLQIQFQLLPLLTNIRIPKYIYI